jgi:hypothetical protein
MYNFKDIKNYIKINGVIQFSILPLRKILSKIFVISRGTAYYFNPGNIPEKKHDQSIIVRRSTFDDLDKLKEINPNIASFRDFLKNNDIFIIALINEQIVGHLIISKEIPKRYKNLINLKSDEAYVREGYINPRYRNRGIYSLIFACASKIAESEGYSKIFGVITSNNQKSTEIHTKKFGFYPLFRFIHIRFLFLEKNWISAIQN